MCTVCHSYNCLYKISPYVQGVINETVKREQKTGISSAICPALWAHTLDLAVSRVRSYQNYFSLPKSWKHSGQISSYCLYQSSVCLSSVCWSQNLTPWTFTEPVPWNNVPFFQVWASTLVYRHSALHSTVLKYSHHLLVCKVGCTLPQGFASWSTGVWEDDLTTSVATVYTNGYTLLKHFLLMGYISKRFGEHWLVELTHHRHKECCLAHTKHTYQKERSSLFQFLSINATPITDEG